MSNSYFITTAIPYVNSKPHVGFAQELLIADAIARTHRQNGNQTVLQTGTDDNAFKNVISAKEAGIDPIDFVNANAKQFEKLIQDLNIKADLFVRTSSIDHAKSVQYFLSQLASEDVFVKSYEGLYCQDCEDFYKEKDLINGVCPDHKKTPHKTNEENVFFRLSKYQSEIYSLIESDRLKITPKSKKNEILRFIEFGLEDISLSRSARRNQNWGISYPGHSDQTVYVWIDALINYISGVGYGRGENWKKVWNDDTHKVHVIGKNVWKFHAIYWIGLLLSAKLPLPNEVVIHGFLTNAGEKISKSLGNGADPLDLIQKYGVDAVRFYLLQSLSTEDDADFVEENLLATYNSELANKFGNLVSRFLALRAKLDQNPTYEPKSFSPILSFKDAGLEAFKIIGILNSEINQVKPWELLKAGETSRYKEYLERWQLQLFEVEHLLKCIIPDGCDRFLRLLEKNRPHFDQLFPRKNSKS